MLAADGARVEHGEQDGGEWSKHQVYGKVVESQAAAGDGGAEDAYLDGGDEVAGVDEVDEGPDLQFVAAWHVNCMIEGQALLLLGGGDWATNTNSQPKTNASMTASQASDCRCSLCDFADIPSSTLVLIMRKPL